MVSLDAVVGLVNCVIPTTHFWVCAAHYLFPRTIILLHVRTWAGAPAHWGPRAVALADLAQERPKSPVVASLVLRPVRLILKLSLSKVLIGVGYVCVRL
jgi:hypothetical protein